MPNQSGKGTDANGESKPAEAKPKTWRGVGEWQVSLQASRLQTGSQMASQKKIKGSCAGSIVAGHRAQASKLSLASNGVACLLPIQAGVGVSGFSCLADRQCVRQEASRLS